MKKNIALIMVFVLLSQMFGGLAFAEAPSNWAKQDIEELRSTEYFETNRFTDYKKPITRLEFIYFAVKLLEIMSGSEIEIDSSISFTDTSDIWALKGATVGITAGTGNDQFSPNTVLTREQFASMIVRTMQLGNMSLLKPGSFKFSDDNEISTWAKEAMYLAKENNILSGVGNNMAAPKENATVEQSIVLINRILKNNQGKDFTYNGKINKIPYEANIKTVGKIIYNDSTYRGEIRNNIPHGYGMLDHSEALFIGELEDNMTNGYGVLASYIGEGIYAGFMSNGILTGIGAYEIPGFTYLGEFENNLPNGYGTSISSTGKAETGFWVDGKIDKSRELEGSVTIPYREGTYTGQIANGVPHGIGTLICPNLIYVGEWENGKYSRLGVYLTDQRAVVGEWQNGFLSGKGVSRYITESDDMMFYVGEWNSSGYNGHGFSLIILEDSYTYYIGQWKDGMKNGQGTEVLTYPNDSPPYNETTYVGEWKNDKRHGHGKNIDITGKVQIGQWFNDKFVD